MSRFDGKVVLVTGAGSGIGEASARRFAGEGALVIAVDLDASALDHLGSEIALARTIAASVADEAGVADIFGIVRGEFGRIDVLVNNAGIGGPRTLRIHELSLEDFDAVHAVNLRGPLMMAQQAIPMMIAQGGGAIVNTVSTSAYHAVKNCASYSISKAGIAMLTRCIAREYGGDGIRCNGVAPGVTATPLLAGLPKPHLDAICDTIPMGRIAAPAEIAAVIAFLASDEASFINGDIQIIDGGANT